MRKWISILLAALLLLSLTACGDAQETTSTADSTTSTTQESTTTTAGEKVTTTSRSRTQGGNVTGTTAFDGFISTVGEKPFSGNSAILYNKQTSRFDSQAESLRQSILKEKDTVKAKSGGTTYYISPNGDDSNPGTSKDKAWRTTKNLLNPYAFNAGDAILFERGGVYRNVSFQMANGVSYGAYGSGTKPNLYGSAQNYADESLWKETSTENVWRIKLTQYGNDVGNVVFDHGKQFGLKMMRNTLEVNYQFYHDATKGYLYLYLDKGNPGKLYSDIEICDKRHVMYTNNSRAASDITIENLCIKYGGAHGIVFQAGGGMETKNVTIRGCEIGWIGGSLLNSTVRYGNGIELNGGVDGALIEDNWIYQCYDAGYTNQGKPCYQKGITVQDNLIEYNPYNIEVWTEKEIGKGGMKNCTFKNNTLRFAGFGFGTLNRFGSGTVVIGNISLYDYVVPCENVLITGNIFDCSYRYLVSIAYPNDAQGRGPTIKGNTWNQKPFENSDTYSCVNKIYLNGTEILKSDTLDQMKASVAKVDTAPKAVTLEK